MNADGPHDHSFGICREEGRKEKESRHEKPPRGAEKDSAPLTEAKRSAERPSKREPAEDPETSLRKASARRSDTGASRIRLWAPPAQRVMECSCQNCTSLIEFKVGKQGFQGQATSLAFDGNAIISFESLLSRQALLPRSPEFDTCQQCMFRRLAH